MAARNDALSSSGSIVSRSIRVETKMIASPTRTRPLGANRDDSADPPSAATKSPTDAGSMRTPVSRASSPWTTWRNRGTVKKIPIRIMFWDRSIATPPRRVEMSKQPEVDERIEAAGLAAPLPRPEAGEDHAAGRDHERGQRHPQRLDGRAARDQPAPVAGLKDPEDHQRETRRGQHPAEPVEVRHSALAGGLADQAGAEEDPERDDHLAEEHEPPGEVRRDPAAEDRPDRDSRSGDSAEHSVGQRPVAPVEVPGHQRDECGEHERRPDALEDRPAEGERRDAPGCAGQGRAGAVDAQPDHEGAAPAIDVAELPADEHQRRHRQGVEGDHDLDRRDGGVEVLDELRDRDVHHGLVEHHQELGRAEDGEDSPFGHRAGLYATLARWGWRSGAPGG